jgi:hypothetical protein
MVCRLSAHGLGLARSDSGVFNPKHDGLPKRSARRSIGSSRRLGDIETAKFWESMLAHVPHCLEDDSDVLPMQRPTHRVKSAAVVFRPYRSFNASRIIGRISSIQPTFKTIAQHQLNQRPRSIHAVWWFAYLPTQ